MRVRHTDKENKERGGDRGGGDCATRQRERDRERETDRERVADRQPD